MSEILSPELNAALEANKKNRQRPGDQPLPVETTGPIMHELVIDHLRRRLEVGVERYGQPLRAFNGRNAAQDALEEALDLTVYLQQLLIERERLIDFVLETYQRHGWLHARELLESLGVDPDGPLPD